MDSTCCPYTASTSADSCIVADNCTIGPNDRKCRRRDVAREMGFVDEDTYTGALPAFKKITVSDMPIIMPYLLREKGRTTDFSLGGLLMWVDCFQYEYAILHDTLFIKGVLENHITSTAFSLPIGHLPLRRAIAVLKEYCNANGLPLFFSAIPEYALPDYMALNPAKTEKLEDWGDYLYDARSLATLTGKRYNKKRNHVNKFLSLYPDWQLRPIKASDRSSLLVFMDEFEKEGDDTPGARIERELTRKMIGYATSGIPEILGAVLEAGGETAAFCIGDVKGDTMFVHVEKALRRFEGSYEMINKEFARFMTSSTPGLQYINREDDAGDPGLRKAKLSYHPLEILTKYNVYF